MARGGARKGAGRPKMTPEQVQEQTLLAQARMMDELLVPSFKASKLGQDELEISPDDIKRAYGEVGLRVWKTWYHISKPAVGIGHGHTITKWKLKLKMTVVARALLDKAKHDLPFPSEALHECIRRRDYEKWVREYTKHAAEFSAEFGHAPTSPPPFESAVFARRMRVKPKLNKPQFDGWRELIDGEDSGHTLPYDGFVPNETDVPY